MEIANGTSNHIEQDMRYYEKLVRSKTSLKASVFGFNIQEDTALRIDGISSPRRHQTSRSERIYRHHQ